MDVLLVEERNAVASKSAAPDSKVGHVQGSQLESTANKIRTNWPVLLNVLILRANIQLYLVVLSTKESLNARPSQHQNDLQ